MAFKDIISFLGFALFALAGIAALLNLAKGNNPMTGEPWSKGNSTDSTGPEQTVSLKNMPPIDIGRTLALSLDVSCNINDISSNEHELLSKAKISKEAYNAEKTLLAAFAQHSTIFTSIRNESIRSQVLSGYMEVWDNIGKSGKYGAVLHQYFPRRCQAYAHAVRTSNQGAISPIALEFGRYLGEGNGVAQVIALTFAEQTYQTHVYGTLHALEHLV